MRAGGRRLRGVEGVRTEAEASVMWLLAPKLRDKPEAQEFRQPLEPEKDKASSSAQEFPEGTQPC